MTIYGIIECNAMRADFKGELRAHNQAIQLLPVLACFRLEFEPCDILSAPLCSYLIGFSLMATFFILLLSKSSFIMFCTLYLSRKC